MFSCEYWKNFKNTYFEEHLQTAGSIVRNVEYVVMKICVQRRTQSTVRYLRESVLSKQLMAKNLLTVSANYFIFDVCQGAEYIL